MARSDVVRYAVAARMSKERVMRRLIIGEIKGTYNPDTGGWSIDAAEFDRIAAKSIDAVDVSRLSPAAEITL